MPAGAQRVPIKSERGFAGRRKHVRKRFHCETQHCNALLLNSGGAELVLCRNKGTFWICPLCVRVFQPPIFPCFSKSGFWKNASIPPKPGNKEHWVGSFRCKRLIRLSYPRLLSPLSDLFHAEIVSWIKMIQKIMFYWFLDILLDTKPSMDVILFFFSTLVIKFRT